TNSSNLPFSYILRVPFTEFRMLFSDREDFYGKIAGSFRQKGDYCFGDGIDWFYESVFGDH
ncbi:MAG: hypothetical protein ABF753_12110, partial [Lentilactobacillus hilgardii]|uniref:hypothetical protein n=1 Tax=Lentilactobacillus hilgardii TaxID=1588 RepID=UPI0039EB83AE